MTGFFTCVLGEVCPLSTCTKCLTLLNTVLISVPCLQFLTGKGALGQLRLETSLNPSILKALVGTIVVFNLVTALLPNATFSEENQKDVRKRPAGKTCSLFCKCNTLLVPHKGCSQCCGRSCTIVPWTMLIRNAYYLHVQTSAYNAYSAGLMLQSDQLPS